MGLPDSGRGVGIVDLFRTSGDVPAVLFGLVTQLGDLWVFLFVSGVLYVAGGAFPRLDVDRRRGLFVLALVVGYVTIIVALKGIFSLPRPPGADTPSGVGWLPSTIDVFLTTADGSGFPSGHALGSTMVWGGLALVIERGTRRARLATAGALVGVVALSRLVLGVHYLIDVVAGVALGVVALGALSWLSGRGTAPGRALLVAAAIGVVGLVQTVTLEGAAATGGAIGGWITWRTVGGVTPARPTNRRALLAGVAVLAVAGGLFGLVYVSVPSHLSAFLGAAVAVGGVVGAPALGERVV